MVTYDAGLISFYFCACEENKVVKAGFSTFLEGG